MLHLKFCYIGSDIGLDSLSNDGFLANLPDRFVDDGAFLGDCSAASGGRTGGSERCAAHRRGVLLNGQNGPEHGQEFAPERLARDGVQEEVYRMIQVLKREEDAFDDAQRGRGREAAYQFDCLQCDDGRRCDEKCGRDHEQHDCEPPVGRGHLWLLVLTAAVTVLSC